MRPTIIDHRRHDRLLAIALLWLAIGAALLVTTLVPAHTALLGWAMLSLPHSMKDQLLARKDDMLRFLGETYGTMAFGPAFGSILGWVVGIVFFLLLLSAANTAIVAMIGLLYMMANDGEMPGSLKKLNGHGVPLIPLFIALALPVVVLIFSPGLEALAGLYAIGVVGAVTVNLGSCAFNKGLAVKWWERSLFMVTFLVLFCVEVTLAKTKPDALFFVLCVLGLGLGGHDVFLRFGLGFLGRLGFGLGRFLGGLGFGLHGSLGFLGFGLHGDLAFLGFGLHGDLAFLGFGLRHFLRFLRVSLGHGCGVLCFCLRCCGGRSRGLGKCGTCKQTGDQGSDNFVHGGS